MHENDGPAPPSHLLTPVFRLVTARPKTTLAIWAAVILAFALQIPRLERNTSVDAYIPQNDPVVKFTSESKQKFDLYDPVVVLVKTNKHDGIFNARTLNVIKWYSEKMAEIDGIDPTNVASIFTETVLRGDAASVTVQPLIEKLPENDQQIAALRESVMSYPLHLGILVARDGSAAIIAGRVTDPKKGGAVYNALVDLRKQAPVGDEETLVAGEAVLGEFLGVRMMQDAARINPRVVIGIAIVLLLSYRTWRGLTLPGMAAVSGAAVALGSMALVGEPFSVMSNILPANIIALGVAYGIHILREYYEQTAAKPGENLRDTVVNVMLTMRRPVVYATITDMIGFIVLSITMYMPPVKSMAEYAALGIAVTLISTLIVVPAWLVLLRVRPSPALPMKTGVEETTPHGIWSRGLAVLGNAVLGWPRLTLIAFVLIGAWCFYHALRIQTNENRAGYFGAKEPIYIANEAINSVMDGTITLDVVVHSDEPEGLSKLENLRKIEKLQRYLESLPHIKSTLSVVDLVKQMNRAMQGGGAESFVLPNSDDLAAQYYLLYSMDGSSQLAHFIDADHQTANVQAMCNSGLYSEVNGMRNRAQEYLDKEFSGPGLTAKLSGRISVYYAWMRPLEYTHFLGATLSLIAVFIMTSVAFRSWVAGVYCLIPVIMTLLAVYAVMDLRNIWLGIGTASYASIAIGITVNFSIHELDRIVHLTHKRGMSLDEALHFMYSSTGRAVFFNFLAVFLGISMLTQSNMPSIQWFGTLLAAALLVGFVASMMLLPAMVAVFKPKFLIPAKE